MFDKQKNHDIYGSGSSFGEKLSHLTKKQWALIITAIVLVVLIIVAIIVVPSIIGKVKDNVSNEQEISSIYVREYPDKVRYHVGEAPDYSGLIIAINGTGLTLQSVQYDDSPSDFIITGFDSSAPQTNQVITVDYKGFKTTFKIDILTPPNEKVVLQKIEMSTLPKTEFKVGDYPSVKGGKILCTYTDGTTKEIDLRVDLTYGFGNLNTPGEHTITVEYREDGVIVTTTYKITVTE
ncbi:MAG: hypothetical protein E7659_05295 [Ruminococcaceae bacterium]|nr:hypothetical protein [Oscillospiraceae bacterium]